MGGCEALERFKNGNFELFTTLPLLGVCKLEAEPMEDTLPRRLGMLAAEQIEDTLPCRLNAAPLGLNADASSSVFCFEKEKRLTLLF